MEAKATIGQMPAADQPERLQDIRIVLDTIPALAWSARPDGSADFFNQRWLEYTGFAQEQALDWGWKTAIHPADLPRILDVFQEAVNFVRPFEVEGRFRRFDGEYRWFLFRGNPLCDESGKVVKWYGTNADLEDRKRAEEVLRADIEARKQVEARLRENEAHLLEVQRLTRTGSWRLNTASGKVTVSPEVRTRQILSSGLTGFIQTIGSGFAISLKGAWRRRPITRQTIGSSFLTGQLSTNTL